MTVSAPSRRLAIGLALTVVGGLLAIAGTLLPWIQANANQVLANSSSSQLGVEFDDGKIFVFVALLTIVASGCSLGAERLPAGLVQQVGRLLGNGATLAVLTGGYVLCFGVVNLRDVTDVVSGFNAHVSGLTSVGIGIYLDLAAGIVILAGAAVGLLARRG
jgi:hypothetical protein